MKLKQRIALELARINFRQENAIIGANNPRQASFDASCIWGPLMGIKAHIGFRFTLWK